jgi:hypothetical protein
MLKRSTERLLWAFTGPKTSAVHRQHYSSSSVLASVLMAALLVFAQGVQAAAQPVCKPLMTVRDAHFSEPVNLKRYWTAVVQVDASRCATVSGLFALGFVRLAENGPDLEFAEPFLWQPEQTKVRVEFWVDEAVHKYWISDVATCPCRGN